ncbi:MAG: MotA/TolQ/ExbB proton channel family protein [Candidatus Omnitrophica bacterium]|nr:MotA/TolQ/ExbB proton channel family protein [Candidatus Omnitrophota bacterium]
MLEIIQKGGPVMIPILLCSIVALAVALERLHHFYRVRIDTKKFLHSVLDAVRRNKIKEAIEVCEQTPSPVARILKTGLMKHDQPKEEIREAMEDAAHHTIPRLEQNLGILGTISHIAPLLGLLGTVTGLVRSFQVIQEKSSAMNPINPGDLAGGIWEALLTTVAGLTVAIPTIVLYNYLVNRVNRFVNEMEIGATELLEGLSRRGA